MMQPVVAGNYEPLRLRHAENIVLSSMILNAIRCMPGGMCNVQNISDHPNSSIRYAASVAMGITYRKVTPTSYSDPKVVAVNHCLMRLVQTLRPGAYLVDIYPFLQYVPGYFTRFRKWHREELEGGWTPRRQMVMTYDRPRLRDSVIM